MLHTVVTDVFVYKKWVLESHIDVEVLTIMGNQPMRCRLTSLVHL